MTAENVLPIIKALDAKEQQRLMQMLGVGAEKKSSTKIIVYHIQATKGLNIITNSFFITFWATDQPRRGAVAF